jgi:two-component sensor histidine kinase
VKNKVKVGQEWVRKSSGEKVVVLTVWNKTGGVEYKGEFRKGSKTSEFGITTIEKFLEKFEPVER